MFRTCVILIAIFNATPLLSDVLTWDCSFNKRVDADGMASENMNLVFKVDTFNEKAFMEGNLGLVEVGWYAGDSAFSFTERLYSGAIQTTTITKDGMAIHSRNTIILNEIVGAQHFGICDFKS